MLCEVKFTCGMYILLKWAILFLAIILFEMNILVNMDVLSGTAQNLVRQVNDTTFPAFPRKS